MFTSQEKKLFDWWIVSCEPRHVCGKLLEFFLRFSIGERTKRLLSVAFVRETMKRTNTGYDLEREVCTLVEDFADGQRNWGKITQLCNHKENEKNPFRMTHTEFLSAGNASEALSQVSWSIYCIMYINSPEFRDSLPQWQGEMIVDFATNRFYFDPQWKTSDAVALARGMYDTRDFSAMPILADALQDAGCADEIILERLRNVSHAWYRGCWLIDFLIGKQ